MFEEVYEFISTRRIKRPAYNKIAQWVKVTWNNINIEKIKKSFKCYRISVAKDNTENNLIFDYDLLNNKNENSNNDKVFEDSIYDNFIKGYENS